MEYTNHVEETVEIAAVFLTSITNTSQHQTKHTTVINQQKYARHAICFFARSCLPEHKGGP